MTDEHEHKEHKEHEHKIPEHKVHHAVPHKKVHKRDSETIEIDKVTVWKAISAILVVLLAISVYTGGFGIGGGSDGSSGGTQGAQPAQPRDGGGTEPSAPLIDMAGLIDDDTVKGDSDALVTIVEWSDFECPFCTRFYEQTLGQIRTQYIDTGKAKMVYRDFPLSFHANAQKSAEAAECAGEQGKYWEMHDTLFDNGVSGGVSSFKQFAADLGLDTEKFDSCLDNGDMASEVAKDMQDGTAVGIRGTPGFIINGKLISGAQPFSVFQAAIEEALAE